MSIFGSTKVLSIDFGSNSLKAVEGKYSKKGVVIDKSHSVKIPKRLYSDGIIEDMDQLTYLLRNDLFEKKNFTGDVHAVIDSTKVIMREITIPKVDKNQVDAIIKYQLAEYLPVAPEEYVVNYIILGSFTDDDAEKLNILLVGIPKIIVESHFNLFKNLGLKPTVLDYSGNAINKLLYMGEKINDFYESKGTIACVDLGYEGTGLTISKDGVLKVSRLIEGGSRGIIKEILERHPDMNEVDIAEQLDSIKDINQQLSTTNKLYEVSEVARAGFRNTLESLDMIFRYYKTREIGNNIDLIVLHGGFSKLNGIEKLFNNFFDIQCIKLNQLSKVKFSGELSDYATAIGGLIRLSEVKK